MALSLSKLIVLPILILLLGVSLPPLHLVSGQLDTAGSASLKLISDATEWPTTTSLNPLLYDVDDEEDSLDYEVERRWLFWRRFHYYISYAALSANRIPCRPGSGRSYYSHNCNSLSGPVHPYVRSCSAITRCRR